MPPQGKCMKCGARFQGWALEVYGNHICICRGDIIIEPSEYIRIIERHPSRNLYGHGPLHSKPVQAT